MLNGVSVVIVGEGYQSSPLFEIAIRCLLLDGLYERLEEPSRQHVSN